MKSTLLLALLAATVGTLAEPEFQLISRQAGATVHTSCTRANTVALTFDDGPYVNQQSIINTLNSAGIKGTFFITGNLYGCVYGASVVSSLRSAVTSGHQVASHTWSHPYLTNLNSAQINDEMSRLELAMRRILGRTPAFMRPPYGSYNDLVRQVALSRNQSLVTWDFDSGDWSGIPIAEQKQRYTDIANRHPNNILTLNHETYQSTANELLPHAISVLKAKGYTFATVSECLGQQPYTWIGCSSARDSSWVC